MWKYNDHILFIILLYQFFFQENQITAADETECKPKLSNKGLYANLKKYLASIKESCGQVCDTSITGEEGKYYQVENSRFITGLPGPKKLKRPNLAISSFKRAKSSKMKKGQIKAKFPSKIC